MITDTSVHHEVVEQQQYLTFLQGNEQFAVALLHVKEIIEYTRVTAVPMVPEFIRGVINLRGSVVPVVDLKARFGYGRSDVTKRTSIIIVEIPVDDTKQSVGILVDAVNTVLDIPASDIEPPPRFGAKLRTDFIGGMGKIADKFVIILAVDKVLSVDEMAALIQTTA